MNKDITGWPGKVLEDEFSSEVSFGNLVIFTTPPPTSHTWPPEDHSTLTRHIDTHRVFSLHLSTVCPCLGHQGASSTGWLQARLRGPLGPGQTLLDPSFHIQSLLFVRWFRLTLRQTQPRATNTHIAPALGLPLFEDEEQKTFFLSFCHSFSLFIFLTKYHRACVIFWSGTRSSL